MSAPVDRGRVDKAPLIRHVALCVAAVVAYVLHAGPHAQNAVVWVVLASAVLNLAASIGSRLPRPGPTRRILSSGFGLAGWSALAALSGGVTSPLIAGLGLEIVLAALDGPPAAIPLTTAAAIVGLWAQQIVLGLDGHLAKAILLTGFLLLSGGLMFHLARRWAWSESGMARQIGALRVQLARLESELAPAHGSGEKPGEAARLAHGLKNTVHSMRGLVRLIEPQLRASARSRRLLEGLRFAIDNLEQTARITLGPAGPTGAEEAGRRVLTPRDVRDVVQQIAAAFPGVTWRLSLDGMPPAPSPAAPLLRDALVNVLRNAAEAMRGRGEIFVEAAPRGGCLVIRVRDRGPGLSPDLIPRLFEPGRTTKEGGHGLGLLLARQHVEAGGGRLTLAPAEGGGMLCSMELPLSAARTTLAGAR